jgi:hypothetical protein
MSQYKARLWSSFSAKRREGKGRKMFAPAGEFRRRLVGCGKGIIGLDLKCLKGRSFGVTE